MKKLILGIDSSLSCPAFAVIEVNLTNRTAQVIKVSHIKTSSKKSTGYRLFQIYNHFLDILHNYDLDEVVIEKGFNKFAMATQQIQRTVGVILFAQYTMYRNEVEDIHEIAPTSVKKAITGNGKASKDELAEGLIKYVGDVHYRTNDESDAVGVALAYAIQNDWI